MNERMSLALEVQAFAEKQLCPDDAAVCTDVDQWNQMQFHLAHALADLEGMEGVSPEEEGELVLAILMGYCVTMRNGSQLARALKRARRVLPYLTDRLLKCKLAAHCYMEFPDEELLLTARSLIGELKREGKGNEVIRIEEMIS